MCGGGECESVSMVCLCDSADGCVCVCVCVTCVYGFKHLLSVMTDGVLKRR